MAERIMAGSNTPGASNPDTPPAGTTFPDAPTAADRLENTLEKLNSLLWCCHGTGDGWFEEVGEQHRDNLLWIASDLAREAVGLFQESAGELRTGSRTGSRT